jgi:hypothetical protein
MGIKTASILANISIFELLLESSYHIIDIYTTVVYSLCIKKRFLSFMVYLLCKL